MSSTNILLLAVLVEVRRRRERSLVRVTFKIITSVSVPLTFLPLCVCVCVCVCLQHVLILVKVVLAVMIPDEPDWIRKKREHIEYTSMQALRQQVNPHIFHHVALTSVVLLHLCDNFSFFSCRSCFLKSPDCVTKH